MATNQEAGRARRKYDTVLLEAGYTPEEVEAYYEAKREYNRKYREANRNKSLKDEARRKQVLSQARYFLKDTEPSK